MRVSIVQRLWLLVTTALLALVAVGTIGGLMARSALNRLEYIHTSTIPAIETLNAVERTFFLIRVSAYAHIVANTADSKAAMETKIQEYRNGAVKLFGDIEKQLVDGSDRSLLEADRTAFATYVAIMDDALVASRNNDLETVRQVVAQRWKPAGDALTANLKAHSDYHIRLADQARVQASVDAREGQWISWGVIVLGTTLMVAVGVILVRDIGGGIDGLKRAVQRIGNDLDFTVRAPVHGRDELGDMACSFNGLVERLQINLRDIQLSASEVANAAGTLATTSNQVAIASDQQSSAASSMAASVEQMTVSISHVGDRATETRDLAQDSGRKASAGRDVIEQTVGDINEIANVVHAASGHLERLSAQGDQISTVVQVIKEVADQTNLLALNAAIEAARAGEQGRGFAVVADEVRKLAERTAASTQQISETISTMRDATAAASDQMTAAVMRVERGVDRASNASVAIGHIEQGSRRTVETVGEIADAMREQSSASTSVAQNVERIAQMAEEGASAAQNSSEAAQTLDHLAQRMHAVIASYRL